MYGADSERQMHGTKQEQWLIYSRVDRQDTEMNVSAGKIY